MLNLQNTCVFFIFVFLNHTRGYYNNISNRTLKGCEKGIGRYGTPKSLPKQSLIIIIIMEKEKKISDPLGLTAIKTEKTARYPLVTEKKKKK